LAKKGKTIRMKGKPLLLNPIDLQG